MGKKKGNGSGSEFLFRQSYENSFISDVIETYNGITDEDLQAQKNAIRNVMKHIKRAYDDGLTYDDIDDKVLYNMSNLFTIIRYPNLTNFYQLRTLEYMMDIDIGPYVEELLRQGFDLKKYHLNRDRYSASIEKNVMLELYGMIDDFLESGRKTANVEYNVLAEKARNGKLTMEDKDLVTKFITLYLGELEIGKATFWEEQRKNPEACRKLLIKYKNQMFDVRNIDLSVQSSDKTNENVDEYGIDLKTKADIIRKNNKNTTPSIFKVLTPMSQNNIAKTYTQVVLKDFPNSPFIGKDKESNFLVIMSEALSKFDPQQLTHFYEMLMISENGKNTWSRERAKETMHDFFSKISFQKNLLHAREHLMVRLAALITFYKASGCLGEYCDKNNKKLNNNYLGDMQIEEEVLFSKFINNPENGEYYFVDDSMDYERAYRATPLFNTSDEAIIGMSAFYSNRMTKEAQTYSMLGFILDKLCVIEQIGNNPDLTYEDLGCTDDKLCMYMSIYKCFQKLMVKNFFQNVSPTEPLYEEDVHKKISKALSKYKRVYEKYYPELGLSFERDIDYVMMDAQLIDEMYALKSFSVKSLLYTAITDKKKNIINWGFVPEDENTDDKFALLGFDIKTLNTPLFVHMRRSELIKFIGELTGDTKIRVYEGANDMYRHSSSLGWQRVTAQVLYPFSKEEKRKLMKVTGTGALTDYYAHIRWLQQPNNRPKLLREPGSREYDLESKKISMVKKNITTDSPGGKKSGKKNSDKTDR